jgi:hypothetical protein
MVLMIIQAVAYLYLQKAATQDSQVVINKVGGGLTFYTML